jgi:V/A-type H+-transporting ATPase subunit B
MPRTYAGAAAAHGPLLYLPGTRHAALGEWVEIRPAGAGADRNRDGSDGDAEGDGGPVHRGQVIDVGREVTVVQVLEETSGLAPGTASVTLTGELATAVVGRELLGRALSGVGRPVDDLPAPVGAARRPLWGRPMNPVRRRSPEDFIETGISAIDGMNTLVRGQKLPVFSGPGLPALELAARIVQGARAPRGEPFAVVFVAVGITEREAREFLDRFRGGEARERSVFYLNRAADPTIERLLAPRFALAQAEHLAFDEGMEVLVVMADVTHYCEALREIGAAREEMPGRRGYPGYMYTDLATLYERSGVLRGREGSVTQIPVLTMPDDDITHPIPDLTGYITEGQIVLGRDLHRRGVFPPVDVLPSLSRLMNAGIGEDHTVPEHRRWADQLYALYARGREARLTAAIVGEAGLPEEDRRALGFAARFEEEFVHQGETRRSLEETLEAGWSLMEALPAEDLTRIDEATRERRRRGRGDGDGSADGGDAG